MALDPNVQSWLDELKKTGAISEDELKVISGVAEKPQAGEFIKGSVLRQSEFSKKLNEISELKKNVEAEQEKAQRFGSDLAKWKVGADENFRKAIVDREEAQKKYSTAVAKLTAIGTTYGIPENEYKLEDGVIVPSNQPPVDTKNYLTREDVEGLLKKFSTEAALTDASVHDLNVRHMTLYGKPLPNAIEFVQEALKNGKSLSGYFQEKFNVQQREKDLLEESIQKRINEEVAVRETKIRSELQVPAPRASDHGSLLFNENFNPKIPEQAGDAVGAAVAAYSAGKYSKQ